MNRSVILTSLLLLLAGSFLLASPGVAAAETDANGRVKVKGTLRNGKEIEYYAGEIVVGIDKRIKSRQGVSAAIDYLEDKYGLSKMIQSEMRNQFIVKFRVHNASDIISLMYELFDEPNEKLITFALPNGLGGNNIEMPDGPFHEFNLNSKTFESYPFLKQGTIQYVDLPRQRQYVEGEFMLVIGKKDNGRINFDDILALAENENGIIINHYVLGRTSYYILYFPEIKGDEEHSDKLLMLNKKLSNMGSGDNTSRASIHSVVRADSP